MRWSGLPHSVGAVARATNLGIRDELRGLAELALVSSNQLMPKPGTSVGKRPQALVWSTPPRTGSWYPGVLCLAPEEGLGIRNPELREIHLAGINRFRGV
jgi:hypothetical protein